jgi:ComF family protein
MKNLIYPDICFACKKIFERNDLLQQNKSFPKNFRDVFSDVLCSDCLVKICPVKDDKTGFFFSKKHIDSLSSIFYYKDSIVDIVHLLKYNDKIFLAEKISWLILQQYFELYKNNYPELCVFVPMHKKAFRKRGFNQTYLIANETQKLAWKNKIYFPEVHKEVLIKIKNTKSQTELKKEERKHNISNVFKVKNPFFVKGKKILLLDDVCTTGSTLEECAKTLSKSGAKSVDAITFARAS